MKKLLALILVSIFAAPLFAQNFSGKKIAREIYISAPQKFLNTDENLEYSMEWIGIPVGKIFLRTGLQADINGRDYYLLAVEAFPNAFFASFYNVKYSLRTFMDKVYFLPVRSEKYRRIKDKVNKEAIDFNHIRGEIKYKAEGEAPTVIISPNRVAMEGKMPVTYKILADSQDLLSSFYFLRLSSLTPGQKLKINVYYGLRNWVMDVVIGKPYLKSIRRKGNLEVFDAVITSDLNKFVLGDGRLTVCLTADSRRIPIEFKLGIGLGAFRGVIKQAPVVNE